jgi:GntR family transcriptional regulator
MLTKTKPDPCKEASTVLIDKTSPVPYYEQLIDLLKRDIRAKQPACGAFPLPSENELANRHSITRATVRHAMDLLERDGWIYREKGKGSFAAVRRVEEELTQLVSTTEAMRQRGWTLVTRLVNLNKIFVPTLAAKALELEPEAEVYEIKRLRIVEGEPLSVQTSFIPAYLCPRLENNDLTGSLYRLLETRYDLRLWTGREILRARGATQEEARLLLVKTGTPIMYSERISYSSTGTPVEYLDAIWRGDRYDFKVTLTRPA